MYVVCLLLECKSFHKYIFTRVSFVLCIKYFAVMLTRKHVVRDTMRLFFVQDYYYTNFTFQCFNFIIIFLIVSKLTRFIACCFVEYFFGSYHLPISFFLFSRLSFIFLVFIIVSSSTRFGGSILYDKLSTVFFYPCIPGCDLYYRQLFHQYDNFYQIVSQMQQFTHYNLRIVMLM